MNRIFTLVFCCIALSCNIQAQNIAFHENFESPSFADSVNSSQNISGIDDWSVSNSLAYAGQYSDSCSTIPTKTTYLTTDPFSTLGNFVIHFEFDQICKVEFLDIAKIEISVDNGVNWTTLPDSIYLGASQSYGAFNNRFNSGSYGNDWLPANNSAVPDNTWWKHEKFDISGLASDKADVRIRFVLQDGGSPGPNSNYGWFVDNLIVKASVSELDPPEIKILPPVLSGIIYNLGPFDIKATITDSSGVDTAMIIYNINWGINDTTGMTIINTDTFIASLPAVNHKDTVCYKIFAIDAAIANNLALEPQTGCLQFVASSGITFPYIDNFDVQNLWYSTTNNVSTKWELGTPNYGQTSSSHSPPNAWDINLLTPYTSNAEAILWTPVFDFTNAFNATLSFWQNRNIMSNYDGLQLEYTTDGTNWQILGTQNDPAGTNWYNSVITGSSEPAWSGTSSGWKKCEYPLNFLNYSTDPIQFRFLFSSSIYGGYDGISIDDFSITLPPLQEAHMISVTKPLSACDMGLDTITIEICNGGIDPINGGLSASYYFLGGTSVVTEVINTIIPPEDTIQYTFQTLGDFSVTADSLFEVVAFVYLVGDPVHTNDTLSLKVFSGFTPPDPIVSNVTIPHGSFTILTPIAIDTLFWFDDPFSFIPIAQGPYFTTPFLYDTTVYYVQAGGTGTSNLDSLTTTYQGGNSHRGVMFDVTAKNTLTITSFDVNLKNNTQPTMEVWYKTGSFKGYEMNHAPWKLLGSYNVTNNAGDGNPTPLPIGGLTIYAGEKYGIYVTSTNNSVNINYSNIPPASSTYTDDNIIIEGGVGGGYPFFCNVNNRIFNGALHYSTGVLGNDCSSNRIPDTVFVGIPPALDAGLIDIVSPASDYNLGNNEPVTIKIINFGTNPISAFNVSYSIDGAPPVTENIKTTVNPGDSLVYSFSVSANIYPYGIYNFKAYVDLPGDLNQLNDTCFRTVENMQHVYCTSYSTNSGRMDIGNVTISNLNNGNSTPVYDNPTVGNTYSDFTYLSPVKLIIGNSFKASVSQIFSDSIFYSAYIKIYVDLNIDGIFDESTEEIFSRFTTSSETTVSEYVDIPQSAVAGRSMMRVVMEQTSVASNVHPCGPYMYGETEDYRVMLYPPSKHDAGIISILNPLAVEVEDEIIPVTVVVRNFGAKILSSIPVAYKLNNGTPVLTNYTGILYPGMTDTFNLPAISIPPLNNNLCAYTILTGDTNYFNDESCIDFYGDPRFNAEAVEITSPVQDCGLGMETVGMKIFNTGIDPIDGNISASYQVIGDTNVITEPVNGFIATGDTLKFLFTTPVDMSVNLYDSVFQIISWVDLFKDPINNNDTTSLSVLSAHIPPDPFVSNVTIPYGNQATLNAVSLDSLFWFNVPAGGLEIATGPSYTTPILYGTTVYWVEARSGKPEIKITEVCLYKGGEGATNPYPIDVTADWDGIELTNVQPAAIDLSAYSIHIEGDITIDYTIPNGLTLNPNETALFTFYGNGAMTNPGNNFYVMSTTETVTSDAKIGIYIKDPDGEILDAVATNGYNFAGGISGVTSSDWSGNIPVSSASAGIIRIYSDKNNASDWVVAENGGPVQTIGTLNPGLVAVGGNNCIGARVPDTVFVGGVPPYDVSVVSIIEPVSDFNLTHSETVKIKIKNYGTQPVFTIPVSYVYSNGIPVTDTIFTSLSHGDTLIHTFSQKANLAAYGIYNFKAYLSYPGDNTPLNDTAYASVENKKFVFCPSYAIMASTNEDIGNVTISNMNNGTATPVTNNLTALNGYTDFTDLPPVILEPGSSYPISISQITVSNTTASCAVNVYIDYNQDGIFDAYTERAFNGTTSSSSTTITGTVHVPATARKGMSVMRVVLDRNTNAPPCGTYDYGETEDYRVMLSPLIPQDAGVVSIIQPFALYNSGATVPVEVKIQNFGTDPINNLDIEYQVNSGAPVVQTYSSAIAPGQIVDVMLTDHSMLAGDNIFCAYTKLAGDTNIFNDVRCSRSFGEYTTSPPYSDNFDGSLNLWWADSLPNQWERGKPAANTISHAYSQPYAWATDLDDFYESNTISYLYSPKFHVFGVAGADSLFFYHFIHSKNSDGGHIQYMSATGWKILGTQNDPNAINWYNSPQERWTDVSAGQDYQLSAYDLKSVNDFAGITQFRFVFYGSNTQNTYWDGWAIDNFRITMPKIPQDAGIIELLEPLSPVIKGNNIQVKVKVKNFGLDPLDTIPIVYKINNLGNIVKELTNISLNPDSTLEYTFAPITPPVNSFRICAYTDVKNDIYTFNDGLCDSIEVIPPAKDAGLLGIEYPLQQTVFGWDTAVAVWIKNFGSDTIFSTDLEYTAAGVVTASETWTGKLASGDSIMYIFNTKLNHPYVGYFYLKVYSKLSGDAYPFNDTIKIKLESRFSDIDEITLEGFTLEQNIPNPARNSTIIYYSVPYPGEVNFEVMNYLGQLFHQQNHNVGEGRHMIELNLSGLSSGIYYYYIEFEGRRLVKKMVVVR